MASTRCIVCITDWFCLLSCSQEALRDLNEELEESHLQTEHDLREELDMTNNKKREVSKYSQFILVLFTNIAFLLRRILHIE